MMYLEDVASSEQVLKQLNDSGFGILNSFYSKTEVDGMRDCIDNHNLGDLSFTNTKDLFAIRQLIQKIPELKKHVFNQKMIGFVSFLLGNDCFLSKAIYFDKPKGSNWFVAYHQDLSISVDRKLKLEEYKNWTCKNGTYGVQPPVDILDNTVTIRIHLDDTDRNNGALKVIPKSHLNGVVRSDSDKWKGRNEEFCELNSGGVMLMKPLVFHASNRSTNAKQRRVIHLEFCNKQLIEPLKWAEYSKLL